MCPGISMQRPLLLIDVDGVISLFGFDPARRPAGRFEVVDGIAHFLSATAGQHLRRLGETFDPVWCTGWEEKANEYLPHALGLPGRFPHLSFGDATLQIDGHWKLAAIDAYAGSERPLAWIDDAHNHSCERWAAERAGPTLLIGTDPATGLTDEHVERLLVWAEGCPPRDPSS
jgi:HAD domain in Swiss Army Knife RNA repair proteins